MSKSFRSVWNASKQAYFAAAETVSAEGKSSSATKAASVIATVLGSLLAQNAYPQTAPPPSALPTGGQVSAGQAQISTSGANMVIQQGSDRAAINWQSFNVGKDAQVQFQQPNAGSVVLNRVMGSDPSQIFGRISSNGQVILTNPAGVYFGKDARVDVGGILATTHGISDADFMAGKNRFARNGSTGSVVNEGEIKSALGGYIALLAPEVRNQGAIIAQMGTVALAAGEVVDLKFDSNNRLTSIRVEPSQIQALVENRHAVQAPGGLIILSAQSMDRLVGGVVKNSGRIEANGLLQQGGRIILSASKKVENTGTISANASAGATTADSGPAGKIEISAPVVLNNGTISAATAQPSVVAVPQLVPTAPIAPLGVAGTVQIQATTFTQTDTGHIDLGAPLQGGTLSIEATGQVQIQGHVDVSAKTITPTADSASPSQGGHIEVSSGGDVEVNNASLDASGAQGGRIQLRAAASTQPGNPQPLPDVPGQGRLAIMGNSTLSVRGRSGQGGRASLLGDHIDLIDTTHIDATGTIGGGTVLVGGDWQGRNGVYQATTVTMTEGASIDASAAQQGDGGTVVLWSDIHRSAGITSARGAITARGGALGGDGGRIETSGHQLAVEGIRIHAGSPKGQAGNWLLDPYDYFIDAAAAASIGSALNNSDVTVTTQVLEGDYGSGTNPNAGGEIRLLANIAKTATLGTTTLTLQAYRRIEMNGYGITSALGGPLNVVLWANFGGAAGGSSTAGGVSALSNISTNGGFVWVGGGSATTTNRGVTVPNGPSVGGMNANHNPIDWNGAISTAGGDVFIWSGTGFSNNGLAAYTGASINAGSGDITIRARNFNWISGGSPVTTTTGRIFIRPDVDGGSFGGVINTDWFNISGATPSRVEFGSGGNTSGISVNQSLRVNGWMGFYGGDVYLNANLEAAATGSGIGVGATGNITVATGVSLRSNGGGISLRSDVDGAGIGYVQLMRNAAINTAGGAIEIGGGNLYSTLGYARGAAIRDTDSEPTINLYTAGVHFRSGVTLNSGGGDITLRGQNAGGSDSAMAFGVFGNGTVIDAGTGRIAIDGYATGSSNLNAQAISNYNGMTLRSASTSAQAVSLVGDATGTSGSHTSLGVNLAGLIEATGAGGGISISGRANSATAYHSGTDINGSVLATSGPIAVVGENLGGGRGLGIYANAALGAKAGTNVTSSSSQIALKGGSIDITNSAGATRFKTTGTLTLAPLDSANSFIAGQTFGNLGLDAAISGLTIGKGSNNANITIDNPISIAGPISIYGRNIYINAGLTTTGSGSGILLKAYDTIIVGVGPSLTVQSNNGPITLWADANVDGGFIGVRENVVFNSANGSTSQVTGGGRITLAGGTTTDADGMPTGYALSTSALGMWGVINPSGVQLAAYSWNYAGGSNTNDIRFYSGGGNVLIQGRAANGTPGVSWFGGSSASATQIIDAGSGTITVNGDTTTGGTTGHGIEFSYYGGSLSPTLRSSSNATTAISISGKSNTTSLNAGYQGFVTAIASGTGGISVRGETTASNYNAIEAGNLNLYAASGNIRVTGIGGTGLSIGGAMGRGSLPSSSSNIILSADSVNFKSGGASIDTSGSLTVEPYSNSFSAPLSWPMANLSLASTLGGLTLGKSSNTQNITLSNALSVSGPVNLFGGTVTLNANLATTDASTGNIAISATGGVTGAGNLSLAPWRSLSLTQSGNSTYSGAISGTSASFTKAGDGRLTLTGSNTYTGATTISAGTLEVGSGGTSGALGSGGVSNSGALQINRSDNLTLANDVSGTGALTKSGANTLTLSGALSYGGTTTISGGALVLLNNTPTALSGSINGPGALRIEAVANDFTGAFSTAGWTFGSTLGGLTLGKLSGADGTGDQAITLPGAINMAGPVTVYGGDIALNAALTSTGGNINLYASGAVTQTGAITAAGLGLQGAGTFTLDNAANSVTTLSGGSSTERLGSLSLRNAAALTIGSVNPTGIYAVGDVAVRSTGNLTLSESINTLSASDSAVVLEAGMSEAVGSFAAGNILISGSSSITTGTGGRAVLYTGSISASTGVTALIGSGSGRFRYNSKLDTSNFTAPLGTGLFAVYRQQPSLTLEANAQSVTYGDSLTLTSSLSNGSATVNGDELSAAVPTLPLTEVYNAGNTAAATLNGSGYYDAGTYSLRVGSAASPLGYALTSPTAGTLTISRRNVTVTANNASKFYSQAESQDATSKLLANIPAPPMLGTGLSNTNLPQPLMVSATTQTLVTKDSSSSANSSTASSQASGIIVEQCNAPSSTVFSPIFAVSLPKGTSTMGAGFSFDLPETVRALVPQERQIAQPQASLPTVAPLPPWLKFDAERLRFDASAVSDGSFPLQLVITAAGQPVIVVISERTE